MVSTPRFPVSEFMTPMPHSIEPNQTLVQAQKRMQELKCRHLPVRSGGVLIGILSERDIGFLAGFQNIDISKTKVVEAMTADPYTVSPDTSLRDVAVVMNTHRYGSALVVDDQRQLLGIFTDTDALKALVQLASSEKPS